MACLKCGGAMEEGHIPDAMYGGWRQPAWYAGPPKKSFWRGMKFDASNAIPVTAQRFTKCGFLELYARPA